MVNLTASAAVHFTWYGGQKVKGQGHEAYNYARPQNVRHNCSVTFSGNGPSLEIAGFCIYIFDF